MTDSGGGNSPRYVYIWTSHIVENSERKKKEKRQKKGKKKKNNKGKQAGPSWEEPDISLHIDLTTPQRLSTLAEISIPGLIAQ